ncbi:hypothetical protein [Thalassolituus oleivorans]|jgi:hypothetical protein|uniref:Porin domain-containing protein n=1 Tax=Thalassolituus oleivorans MIL-1 TaxID=1298593 RepID=M5DVK3_9GAMM|nr:hypothetical protein [Thalassolituus oleivorans]CCU73447.1 hypothetical protein TOL_3051 [Thalassolituus oleivorans MIL-1]
MLRIKPTLLAVAVLASAQASASDDDLRINGFMSVGVGMLSTDDIAVSGFDTDANFSTDTVIALQISKQINETTSATTQLVSRGSEEYDTNATWAYISYAINNDTDVRVGRLRTPFFYYSDFLEVGYAYNWVRPPEEVYRLDAFSSVNGIDVTHRFSMGSTDGSVQTYFGRVNAPYTIGDEKYEFEAKNISGIVLNLNRGNFGTRLSYHRTDLYADLDPAGSRTLDSLLAAATSYGRGDDFDISGQTAQFMGAAGTWDNGEYAFVAEYTALRQETESVLDDNAFLLTGAKRFGTTTVHATYTSKRDLIEGDAIQKNLKKMAQLHKQAYILGARYDYDTGTAFKFELQYQDEKTVQGTDGESGMLYSAAIDLVF